MFHLSRGYYEQPGCHNCRHCFVQQLPDRGPSYFCNVDEIRPPVAPAGPYDEASDTAFYEAQEAWEAGREVQPAGRCPLFSSKQESANVPGTGQGSRPAYD